MSNPMLLLQEGLYLELHLKRDTILEDALTQLHYKGKGRNLQKPLKIKFDGEPGVDEGGLTKEFFQILIEKLFDPNFGMFLQKLDRYWWFNHDSLECNLNFELIGMLLGLALYNSTILKLDFPLLVYKKIKQSQGSSFLKDQINLQDLEEFEPELFYSLSNLLHTDFTDQPTGLTYQISYQSWGVEKDYDLIPNGSEIEVTEKNKHDFVNKYFDWFVNTSIKTQFEPFSKGFNLVTVSGESINMFTSEDLFLAICGGEDLDFKELQRTTRYDDGYTKDSQTIKDFWQILIYDFTDKERKNFLKFLTGSDRSPLRGLSDIKLTISRHTENNHLPSAHTCFNHLLLPDYRNYQELKEKLTKAIENFEGFGLF